MREVEQERSIEDEPRLTDARQIDKFFFSELSA